MYYISICPCFNILNKILSHRDTLYNLTDTVNNMKYNCIPW